MKNIFYSITLTLWSAVSIAQVGGASSFQFLTLSETSRIAALGGENTSNYANDINSYIYNPALLSPKTHNQLSVNYLPFYADIKKISSHFGYNHKKYGPFAIGIQHMSYGTMKQTEINGLPLGGDFSASETALMIGKSHTIGPFTIGASVKWATSNIAAFRSSALLMDVGGTFKHPKKDWTVGLVVKNSGVTLRNYTEGIKTPLPFDVQVGTSFKPEHLPLRFHFVAHHLYPKDIVYFDTTLYRDFDDQGKDIAAKEASSEQIFRRLVVGGEFILFKSFSVLAGYNHQRRKEMRLQDRPATAGFSFGFIVNTKRFNLGFTRAAYHIRGATTSLSLVLNLSEIIAPKATQQSVPTDTNTSQ